MGKVRKCGWTAASSQLFLAWLHKLLMIESQIVNLLTRNNGLRFLSFQNYFFKEGFLNISSNKIVGWLGNQGYSLELNILYCFQKFNIFFYFKYLFWKPTNCCLLKTILCNITGWSPLSAKIQIQNHYWNQYRLCDFLAENGLHLAQKKDFTDLQ